MQFVVFDPGTRSASMAVTTPSRANELYPVRPVLEVLCDRAVSGLEHGTLNFVLFLSEEGVAEVLRQADGIEFTALKCSIHLGKKQTEQLKRLAPVLDLLPPGAEIPPEVLNELRIPLPLFSQHYGHLTLAEHIYRYRTDRRSENVSGFTSLTLDLDLAEFLARADETTDLFGLRYVAAAAYANTVFDDWVMPGEVCEAAPPRRGRPEAAAGIAPYDARHPLAGSDLYEIRHQRRRLRPTPNAVEALARVQHFCDWTEDFEAHKAIANFLVGLLRDAGISPSCVTFSGRGLHVRWRFSHWVPVAAGARVATAQRALHALLIPFGSDGHVVGDKSRVFRLPGQLNERVSRRVLRFRSASRDRSHGLWLSKPMSLDHWCGRVLLNSRREWEALRSAANEVSSPSPQYRPASVQPPERRQRSVEYRRESLRKMGLSRLSALLKLAEIRGGIFPGERNVFLFCAAQLIRSSVPDDERESWFQEFASRLIVDLPERELQTLRNGLYPRRGRRLPYISNRYICEVLRVTPAELEAIPGLTPKDQRVAAWRRFSRQMLLARLLASGAAPRLVERVMGYKNSESIYVMTSRLYSGGVLDRNAVHQARLDWARSVALPFCGPRRRVAVQAAADRIQVPAMVWLKASLDTPGRPRAGPDDPRLCEPITRAAQALDRCVMETQRSLLEDAA